MRQQSNGMAGTQLLLPSVALLSVEEREKIPIKSSYDLNNGKDSSGEEWKEFRWALLFQKWEARVLLPEMSTRASFTGSIALLLFFEQDESQY